MTRRNPNVSAPAPSVPVTTSPSWSRDLVKEIAMNIGKNVAHHIETMYPDAVKAASSTLLLSVRNSVYNGIIGALDTSDETEIRARLQADKKHRRAIKAAYKNIRENIARKAEQTKEMDS